MNLDISDISDVKLRSIITLQKRFKIKRIRRFLNKFSLSKLDKDFSKLDFEQFTKKMVDKSLILNIDFLLLIINRYLNPDLSYVSVNSKKSKSTARIFLSMYLIKYHSSDVFTTISKHEKDIIRHFAINLIDFLNRSFLQNDKYTNYSICRFGVLFNSYYLNYNLNLEVDKNNLISEAYRHYVNIQTTKRYVIDSSKYSADQKLAVLKTLDLELKETKQMVLLVDKNFDSNKFDSLNGTQQKITEKLKDQYWQNMYDDLTNEKYDQLIHTLIELKTIIIDLHPENKNDQTRMMNIKSKNEMRIFLDEYVNVDEITNKTITKNYINHIANYLYQSVTNLQASVRDTDSSRIWKQLLENHNNGSIDSNRFIVSVIREIYNIINSIWMDMILLQYVNISTSTSI